MSACIVGKKCGSFFQVHVVVSERSLIHFEHSRLHNQEFHLAPLDQFGVERM